MAIQVAGTTVIGNSRSLENIASVDATTVSTLTTALTGKQTADAELTAVSGLTTNGLITKTGAGTAATRTVTGTANQITVTNGDGVAGNPTIAAVVATPAEAQAGTDNTKLMTPLRTAQAALGRGQTWWSVPRSVNTVFQNTLSKPIVVSYTGTSAAAAASALSIRIEVGPTSPPTLVVNSATAFGLSSTATVSAIVPPNHYYRFSDPVIYLTPIGPKTFVELQ